MTTTIMRRAEEGTAVIIGGGPAGVLAAWALRGAADRVIVLERDHYPVGPLFRPGVPQARHAHLLLEAGHRVLERMLPGVTAQLCAAGAHRVDMGTGLRWLGPAGWMARHHTGTTFLSCTRPLLEHTLLNRVRAEATIEFREGTEARGLTGTPRTVTGVRTRDRGTGVEDVIPAELVIDASGRTTALPRWLTGLGCPPVRAERIDPGVIYLTRMFHRRNDIDPGFTALYLQTHAPDHRGTGSLLPVEADRWICSLGAMNEPGHLSGVTGFDTLLHRLRDPILRETLTTTKPFGTVRSFHPGPSVRRHYQRDGPAGLLVLGDAETSFNPVYGQGLTIAALTAHALREILTRTGGIGHHTARQAQRAIAAVSRTAWDMSAGEDLRFPGTYGPEPTIAQGYRHRYLDHVLARATTDPTIAAAFTHVMSLTAPPTTLLRPRVLASALLPPRNGKGAPHR